MKTKPCAILALSFFPFLISSFGFSGTLDPFAPNTGDSAGRRSRVEGRGGDGQGTCYFAYHILKLGESWERIERDITYRILLTNIGDCDLQQIQVADFLPQGTELAWAFPGPSRVWGSRIIWDNISLRVGERAVFEINVRASHPWRLPAQLTNQGCAFTPWIGIRICDFASTNLIRRDDFMEQETNSTLVQ